MILSDIPCVAVRGDRREFARLTLAAPSLRFALQTSRFQARRLRGFGPLLTVDYFGEYDVGLRQTLVRLQLRLVDRAFAVVVD